MGKKHRKPERVGAGAAPVAPPPVDTCAELRAALTALRPRRAIVLSERLDQSRDVPLETRRRLGALAREAQIRELFDNGHAREACEAAQAALTRDAALAEHWSLGLRVRCGLVPDVAGHLADPAWVGRLRLELPSPADLAGLDAGEVGADAAAVLQAWELAARDDGEAALTVLKRVGRHSPLVDWRLCVQTLIHAQEGDWVRARTVHAHMLDGCCAKRLASQALLAETGAAALPADSETGARLRQGDAVSLIGELAEAIRTHGVDACVDTIARVARALSNQRRRGLLACVLASCARAIDTDAARDRFQRRLNGLVPDAWLGWLRSRTSGAAHLAPDAAEDVLSHSVRGTPEERAMIMVQVARAMREGWQELVGEQDFDPDWDEEVPPSVLRQDLASAIRKIAREAVQSWPKLTGSYDLWEWAEHEVQPGSIEPQRARAAALPERQDAWDRLAAAAAVAGRTEDFERAVERLATFAGSGARCETLRHLSVYHRTCTAYRKGKLELARTEAAHYTGNDPLQLATLRAIEWLASTEPPDKAEAGRRLAELHDPWLVLLCVQELEPATSLAMLPAAVRESFSTEPERVVTGFLTLVRAHPEQQSGTPTCRSLLTQALEDQRVPAPLVAEAALAMLLPPGQTDIPPTLGNRQVQMLFTVTTRLLHTDDTDLQALALGIRSLLLRYNERYVFDARRLDRASGMLQNSAGKLATTDATRVKIRRIVAANDLEAPFGAAGMADLSSPEAVAHVVAAQRACNDLDEICACATPPRAKKLKADKPKGDKPRGRPKGRPGAHAAAPAEGSGVVPAGPRRRAPDVERTEPFDVNRLRATTSIEFDLAIERVSKQPADARPALCARLCELIAASSSLPEQTKLRLLVKCKLAEGGA